MESWKIFYATFPAVQLKRLTSPLGYKKRLAGALQPAEVPMETFVSTAQQRLSELRAQALEAGKGVLKANEN